MSSPWINKRPIALGRINHSILFCTLSSKIIYLSDCESFKNKNWRLTAFEQKPNLIKHWICTVQLKFYRVTCTVLKNTSSLSSDILDSLSCFFSHFFKNIVPLSGLSVLDILHFHTGTSSFGFVIYLSHFMHFILCIFNVKIHEFY